MFDNKIGIRWANAVNEIVNKKNPSEKQPNEDYLDVQVTTPGITRNPVVPNLDITPQGSKQADWRFTPWQKLSQAYNWSQFANVKRYMPYRSRYNATYTDPALVNPEQAIGDIQGAANQQLSSLTTLNPILRNAQAASISGQVMNQVPGVRSQYDNQNAQILNQTRQYNNQVRNNESLVNMANDQNYFRESVEGRKNFENMRQFTANNAMNNLFRDVETNQKLSYNLLTQNNPAYGFDWNTGNFTRNKKSILDANGSPQGDYIGSLLQGIDFPSLSNDEKIRFIRELQRGKALQYLEPGFGQTPPPYKKGGSTKKNPYKW